MRKIITFLFIVPFFSLAQEKGDPDYIFKSFIEANENPEIVYHLSLRKKKLDSFPKNLSHFKNLKSLDLSKNKISLLPAEIKKLNSLLELNVSSNKIRTLPPQIGELKKLKALYLSKNEIEIIPAEIGELENLENLDLWSNNIKQIDSAISNLKSLKKADFRGMLFTEELKDNLKKWLPNAKLHISVGCDCGI